MIDGCLGILTTSKLDTTLRRRPRALRINYSTPIPEYAGIGLKVYADNGEDDTTVGEDGVSDADRDQAPDAAETADIAGARFAQKSYAEFLW